jgi:hypothetical protein
MLKNTGEVLSVGNNSEGQLGINSTTASDLPVYVKEPDGVNNISNIVAIAAGHRSFYMLEDSGKVLAVGSNMHGQFSIGNDLDPKELPVYMKDSGGTNDVLGIIAIAAGDNHSILLAGNGEVFTSGSNDEGQLGIDSSDSGSKKMVQVINIDSAVEIAGGNKFTLITDEEKSVSGFGSNSYGSLGLGYPSTRVNSAILMQDVNNGAHIPSGYIPSPYATADSETEISLNWDDNLNDEDNYRIYRDNVLIDTIASNSVSYLDTGLTESTSYTYKVCAYYSSSYENCSGNLIVETLTAGGGGIGVPEFSDNLLIISFLIAGFAMKNKLPELIIKKK